MAKSSASYPNLLLVFVFILSLFGFVNSATNCPIGQVLINSNCVSCSSINNTATTGHSQDNCACRQYFQYNWNLKKCIIQCYMITGAVSNSSDLACSCQSTRIWNQTSFSCPFNCSQISYSSSTSTSLSSCPCISKFSWNNNTRRC